VSALRGAAGKDRQSPAAVSRGLFTKGKTMAEKPLETIKATLKKILRLAERGVGGEKENAGRILATLLEKHHLTIGDIEDHDREEAKQRYWFRYNTRLERDLLMQCYCRALNVNTTRYWQKPGRCQVGFDLSRLDYLELEHLWSYFRRLWRKEMKRLVMAFVFKHHLCSSVPAEEGDKEGPEQLTEEEIAALVALMRGLQQNEYVGTRRMLQGTK
jgi:hypothetical protein